ncbi:peptidase inhibitor family I36 protein [Streptomyces sp. ISL-44]|uniref:peptidase inhibitor family I36 protein n=1 Tax=Streptomyces sp. ISL-44 TaxID=2819184 RepID=UPI001BE7B538|nr:peptidase inhibitor family I36 protein [Streptomyces sp. ISL-44]MBT2545490.1 peptidase inhibitor family I36 protein [Streptomyces sp. ISL-44]
MAAAGMAATAAPAAAAEGDCPKNTLCLYEGTHYTKIGLTTGSTTVCYPLAKYGETGFNKGVWSYVNNLSVPAAIYHYNFVPSKPYTYDGPIGAGGTSIDTRANPAFGDRGAVCTGGLDPNAWLT